MSFGPLEILLAIVGISILVIVHETGHYLAARAFKMRVLRYSIGFGPTLFKYQPKGSPTIFQVAAVPFLAYVQIAGMNPHEDVDPDDPELFNNKSAFARIVTIAAGPIANYLAAMVLVFCIGLVGWPQQWLGVFMKDDPRAEPPPPLEPATVAEVVDGSAADQAGVLENDIIREANGVPVAHVGELIEQTSPRGGQATEYVIERGGERMTLMLTPEDADGVGRIGVVAQGPPRAEPIQFGVDEAALTSVTFPWRLTELQLETMGKMITHADTSQIGGPVMMVKMVGSAAKRGPVDFFAMLVILSVALGMFNLLPLPALDGGRLFFLAYEVITRRKPNERFETTVHTIGIVFLLAVLVLVTVRDIAS